MADPLAHVYDLALRALDEQERHLVELRNRLAASYLLMSRRLPQGIRPAYAMGIVQELGVVDDEGFYVTMIRKLDELRLDNVVVLRRLDLAFTVMLCGMLVAAGGLAAAVGVA